MADYNTLTDLVARETDSVLLGTIAGAEYHEMRYVMKRDASGSHQIVGRASDWPLIQLRAENAEQAALLDAATRHAAQADQHVVDLMARLEESAQQLAALRAELDRAALIPPQVAAAATGLPIAESELLSCPDCPKSFGSAHALIVHRGRMHGVGAVALDPDWRCTGCGMPGTPSVNEPDRCKSCVRAAVRAITLMPDAPSWRCAANTCTHAHARSLRNPDYCTHCAKDRPLASTNGLELAVGAPEGGS